MGELVAPRWLTALAALIAAIIIALNVKLLGRFRERIASGSINPAIGGAQRRGAFTGISVAARRSQRDVEAELSAIVARRLFGRTVR